MAEAAIPPQHALPRDLWRWRVELPRVADLSDRPLKPTRREWPACQALGERAFAEGWPALVSTSAARPEGRTLCVFRTRRDVGGCTPVPPPARVPEPPLVPIGLRT